ncbi:MAG TPA: hypothetical protein VFJ84_00910 [Candidatus Saccharimonadales bacterium]|nr:hypothetical protein [Candidatus Saccharimonadales bacterium]
MPSYFSLALQKTGSLADAINDRFTSYRLMLYYLLVMIGWAAVGGVFHKVPYSWYWIVISAGWITAVGWSANKLLAKFLDIPANKESSLITALILALILAPATDARGFTVAAVAGLAAIASKYVLTWRKSHIFNPAAAGAFVAGQFFNQFPSWWVGTKFMTPIVILGGFLILRKMKRYTMVGLFLAVYLLYLIFATSSGSDAHFLWLELISTQALFFAIVMLTEPLTSPAGARYYLPYTLLVGLLYSVTRLKLSPEEALLLGNIFTFIFAANRRYELSFVRSVKEAEGIVSYIFKTPPRLRYQPGQYMEWTVAGSRTDSRGNRRYLTVSSSPSEPEMMFTVKQPPNASAFKQKLAQLEPGNKILASRLAGGFLLPKGTDKKLAFLAGGVGITPFRSMVRYMIDSSEKRDAALLYSVNSESEIAFKGLFKDAEAAGLKTLYVTGKHIDESLLRQALPDYKERLFYVSGPFGFVDAMEKVLLKAGVSYDKIVTDYFPGYG